MELSRTERWILANQYLLLEALYRDEADAFAKSREALEKGYELQYGQLSDHIYGGNDVMGVDECQEVLDILDMFSTLKRSCAEVTDRSMIDDWRIQFAGFDGNNETKQMAYAKYYCGLDGGLYEELDRGDDFNSHSPSLGRYRRQLGEWNRSEDRNRLTEADIKRIAEAAVHPDHHP